MTSPAPNDADPLARLIAIMARLRDPDGGCPWDLEQTFATIAPYTIEEAYEVADAIERNDLGELKEELGDLLLQVIFHSRMAEELGAFSFADVAQAICAKMIRRHPHVFGEAGHRDSAEQTRAWEAIKAEERAAKPKSEQVQPHSVLDGVAPALPALTRAAKLTARAARVGFDWPTTFQVIDKLHEEIAELEVEIAAGDAAKAREEMGDLLFVCANLARKLDVEPEDALRYANAKFMRRFSFIEAALAKDGRSPAESDLEEMDRLWDAAKVAERAG
ncbi:MAG: nucleoside triphosphate pyrophosphohydrolase [Caulobacteraceae bacterium]|nr:nucleoside triphosphate pyrophosphohydrolase [Caulobacteraceae bacterium]